MYYLSASQLKTQQTRTNHVRAFFIFPAKHNKEAAHLLWPQPHTNITSHNKLPSSVYDPGAVSFKDKQVSLFKPRTNDS